MGNLGNVVNTIVRMFARKAVDNTMKSARMLRGATRGKAPGHPEGQRTKRGSNAKDKEAVD